MVTKLENFDFTNEITKKELLFVLKKEAECISMADIMAAHAFLVDEGKYVHGSYRDEYLKAYVKAFILRLKEIKDNDNNFQCTVDADELKKALKLLNEQKETLESCFSEIYRIASIYTTFILDEPIHVVGTPFPGGFEVKYENGTYLCPVKEKQKDNPGAVCGFCIAKQDNSV
jgi:uncharacterized protein (UPF0305 family)